MYHVLCDMLLLSYTFSLSMRKQIVLFPKRKENSVLHFAFSIIHLSLIN